jgi:L-aminopeptidase/D-esterase-like protein
MRTLNTITSVPGILVGHETNLDAFTGCTVILCPDGAIGGVDQRGGAPGTRETDLLKPLHMIEKVHGILLAGGAAYGLDAATGVMDFLEEKDIGFNAGNIRVPIVPAAILFDLGIGDPTIRPDRIMGYRACQKASSEAPMEGNVGAGTGCTVGKILGQQLAMKSGIGTASKEIGDGIIIGSIVAVNAFGDVIDPKTGEIIAGVRDPKAESIEFGAQAIFADTLAVMQSMSDRIAFNYAKPTNTVLGVVATNAKLNKNETNKVAQMAHNGLARTIRPAHTMFDGDTIFALSAGNENADVNIVGAFAVEVVAEAVLRATLLSKSADSLPAANDVSRRA